MSEKVHELEDAYIDAGLDFKEVAIDWAIDHEELLRDMADEGCEESAAMISLLDRYFEAFGAWDQAQTDEQFEQIVKEGAS